MGSSTRHENNLSATRRPIPKNSIFESFTVASCEDDSRTTKSNLAVSSKKHFTELCLGTVYALLSGLLFSMCAATVKLVDDVDPGQVAFYQYIAIFVFSIPMVVHGGKNIFGPEKSTKYWLILCGSFDAITMYLSFVSFRYLPLADASVLTSTVPVFVTISARIFLKEKCGTAQVIAIVISVIGVTLVAKLPLVLAERTDIYTEESIIGLGASLGSIASECGIYIILRKLHDVDVFVILLNFGWVALIIDGILTVTFGNFMLTSCGFQQWLLIAVGAFSFLSQLALAKALEMEEAGPVSVLMAAGDIVLAFILDTILFCDSPDSYTIAGTTLIITSVVIVGFKKWINQWTNEISGKRKIFRVMC